MLLGPLHPKRPAGTLKVELFFVFCVLFRRGFVFVPVQAASSGKGKSKTKDLKAALALLLAQEENDDGVGTPIAFVLPIGHVVPRAHVS